MHGRKEGRKEGGRYGVEGCGELDGCLLAKAGLVGLKDWCVNYTRVNVVDTQPLSPRSPRAGLALAARV